MAINEQDLQRALSLRISMQIAVSSIPAVEESMDIDLDRFLDSVPLPPEVPSGTAIDIEVTVGSDLQRMRWSAFGHPAGFIPKMADYLNRCGVQPVDIALINGMGDALQPSLVGHWVAIEDGAVRTGWQFREQRALAELQPFLGSEFAVAKMMAWAVRRDVDFYRGFARSIGKEPSSRVEVPLPGATAAEQLELARSAFEDLLEQPLPAQLIDAIGESEAPDTGLAFELVGGVRPLNNIMPWQHFRHMTDADLKAIFAYLRTLKPVQHRVDNTEPLTNCKLCRGLHGYGDRN